MRDALAYLTLGAALVGGCNAIFGVSERPPKDEGGAGGTGASSTSVGGAPSGGGGSGATGGVPTSVGGSGGTGGWVIGFGSATQADRARGVDVDAEANIYVAGEFHGTASLGAIELSEAGAGDVFLIKVSRDGVAEWAQVLGDAQAVTPLGQSSWGCAVAGNYVFQSMIFNGTVDGHGTDYTALGSDGAVLRYTLEGAQAGFRHLAGMGSQRPRGIASNGNGVVVTGVFDTELTSMPLALTSLTANDGFIVELNEDLDVVAGEAFEPGGDDYALDVAVDETGAVFAAGFEDTTDSRMFVTRRTPSDWTRIIDGLGSDLPYSIIARAGRVYIAGFFTGEINLEGDVLTAQVLGDGLLIALDAVDGQVAWYRRYEGVDDVVLRGLAFDPDDNIIVTGFTRGDIDLGGGVETTTAERNTFAIRLTSEGEYMGSYILQGTGDARAWNVATTHEGDAVIVGEHTGSITVGETTIQSTAATNVDVFIAKVRF